MILGQEPAALQALIADATARLVELAEAGSSSQTAVHGGNADGSHTDAGVESSHAAAEPTELLAPAAVPRTASSSQTRRPQVGGTTTTKHRHAIDDLEEATFEGSVDAMDGFLDDLGEDSD